MCGVAIVSGGKMSRHEVEPEHRRRVAEALRIPEAAIHEREWICKFVGLGCDTKYVILLYPLTVV